MGLFDRRDTLDALEDLLDRERGDILVGNFSGLKRILVEKERLIKAAINGGTLEKLAPLQQKSERNQAMLMVFSVFSATMALLLVRILDIVYPLIGWRVLRPLNFGASGHRDVILTVT